LLNPAPWGNLVIAFTHWLPDTKIDYSKTPEAESLTVYKPNAYEHEISSWACRKVKKCVKKSTSLSGVPITEQLDPEHLEINLHECNQMINHKKCSLGTLINEEGLYHTDKKINLSPRTWLLGSFNWETVCSTNCYLFNTEITMRFGNAHIETLLGDSSHCPFKNGNCYLEDKTQIIWPSNSEKNCEYTPIGTWSGQRMGQTWVADKLPLLLDFPEVPKTVRVCDKNLTISNQGFAVHKENKRRIKRAISGIVTSAQLQSELSYLSWKMAQTMRVSFTHSLHAICNHLEEVRRWAISAAFTDPTTFARVIFENPLIHAKRVSSGIIKIWPCASINRDQYEFITHEEINLEKGICFDKIPIKFKAGSVNKIAFIDPSRMEVVADASKAPCFAYRHQIIQLEDETLEIDQMTAQVKKLETNVLTNLTFPSLTIPKISIQSFII